LGERLGGALRVNFGEQKVGDELEGPGVRLQECGAVENKL